MEVQGTAGESVEISDSNSPRGSGNDTSGLQYLPGNGAADEHQIDSGGWNTGELGYNNSSAFR